MAGPAARRLLDGQMGVEQDRLGPGQIVRLGVEIVEAGLHEGEVGLGEEAGHGLAQEIGPRHVVDVENGEIAVRRQRHADAPARRP